jgi:hypothetical protein
MRSIQMKHTNAASYLIMELTSILLRICQQEIISLQNFHYVYVY